MPPIYKGSSKEATSPEEQEFLIEHEFTMDAAGHIEIWRRPDEWGKAQQIQYSDRHNYLYITFFVTKADRDLLVEILDVFRKRGVKEDGEV